MRKAPSPLFPNECQHCYKRNGNHDSKCPATILPALERKRRKSKPKKS